MYMSAFPASLSYLRAGTVFFTFSRYLCSVPRNWWMHGDVEFIELGRDWQKAGETELIADKLALQKQVSP